MPEPTPLATWDPARSAWVSLFCGHSELYSATWPTSGTTRAGTAYAQPTPAHLTPGSGSSSSPGLPTPKARDYKGAGPLDRDRDGTTRPPSDDDLPTAVARALLPTPSAADGTGGPGHQGRAEGLNLRTAATLLPTPVAADSDRTSANYPAGNPTLAGSLLPTPTTTQRGTDANAAQRPGAGPNLHNAAALLPTPAAGNFNDGESVEQWEARRARVKATGVNGNGMGTPLAIAVQLLPTPTAADGEGGPRALPPKRTSRGKDHGPRLRDVVPQLLPTPSVADGTGGHLTRSGERSSEMLLPGVARRLTRSSGVAFAPAVARWEHITGRLAPHPTEPAPQGGARLSAVFVEWMMGLPAGWVTDVPGLGRPQKLKALGNGVVPQQAALAVTLFAREYPAVVGPVADRPPQRVRVISSPDTSSDTVA